MRVAIIPARGGSRRIPKKNIRSFHGYPMLAYAITVAKQAGLFQRIVVSTDDNEIGKIAYDFGAEFRKRDAYHSQDGIGTQEVAKHVLSQLDGPAFDMACVIYPCVPLLVAEDLRVGYRACTGGAYSMAVGAEPLRDAGAFYWGYTWAFAQGLPLIGPATAMVPLPEERVCDINTEDDWQEADRRYTALLARQKEVVNA